jgi:hypothetical protein
MATDMRLRCLLSAIVLFLGLAPFLCAQNAESRFRFTWTGGEYALHYEVAIEREVDGTYITYLREFTKVPFIEVSLPPGHYRFQVTSYDILNRIEEISRWEDIDVRIADQSEVTDILPEMVSDTLKPILLFAGAAWSPVLPLHGDFFGTGFSPLGTGIRVVAAFPTPIGIRIGAELTMFQYINSTNAGSNSFGYMLSASANLLAMKWLPDQKTSLNFRLGLSYIMIPGTQENTMFNIGSSYLWRLKDKFLLEAGLDYASRIKENSFDGCIRPWIGAGMKSYIN